MFKIIDWGMFQVDTYNVIVYQDRVTVVNALVEWRLFHARFPVGI